MRTRLLAAVAVLAAALIMPSAAFADPPPAPTITTPASTPTFTKDSPISLIWSTSSVPIYHVFRGAGDCTGMTEIGTNLLGETIFADAPGEGTYCYDVVADDATEMSLPSNQVVVTLDTTAPFGSLDTPANGAKLSKPVNVTASPSDPGSGIAQVEFFASDGLGGWDSIGVDTSAPYGISWSPPDGTYDVQAVFTDRAGNQFTTASATGVLVDGTPPTGTLTAPTAGAVLVGSVASVGTANDGGAGVSGVAFQSSPAGANSWSTYDTDATPPYAGSFDTTALADGFYDLRLLVTDGATNSAPSATVPGVHVDNHAPSGTLTAPVAGAVLRGSIAAAATASDGVGGTGVTSVAFQTSPAGAGTWTTRDTDATAPYTGTIDTTVLADGFYDLRVLVSDGATFSAPSAAVLGVHVDNHAPSGTLTAPAAGAVLRGSVAAAATASDGVGGTGVTSVAFQSSPAGANAWSTYDTDTTGPYTGSFDTTLLADGLYDLRVLVSDGATFSAPSATVAGVHVDNHAPSGALTAPGAVLRGSLLVGATASDAAGGTGVATVAFQRSPTGANTWTTYATDGTAPYQVTLDTTIAPGNGVYDLRVLVTDGATLNAPSPVIAGVIFDNHAPDAPAVPNGLTPVSLAPTITFSAATDQAVNGASSGVDHYDVFRFDAAHITPVDVGTIPDNGDGQFTWQDVAGQSSDPAAPGTHTYHYTVRAVDVAGNPGAQSPERVIVLDTTAQSAPTSVAALVSPTSQHPQISWIAPPPASFTADHYDVYRNGGASPVGTVVAPATTFTDPSPIEGSNTYQIGRRRRAMKASSESPRRR